MHNRPQLYDYRSLPDCLEMPDNEHFPNAYMLNRQLFANKLFGNRPYLPDNQLPHKRSLRDGRLYDFRRHDQPLCKDWRQLHACCKDTLTPEALQT